MEVDKNPRIEASGSVKIKLGFDLNMYKGIINAIKKLRANGDIIGKNFICREDTLICGLGFKRTILPLVVGTIK
jgi:hypothetical protein